jgi:FAD:protein FMN transferase
MYKLIQIWVSLLCVLFVSCSSHKPYTNINGFIFGTSYSIKLAHSVDDVDALQIKIEQRLAEVDQAMSSWNQNSEINQFNNYPVNKWFKLSDDAYQVIHLALEISNLTRGYFDITVSPLVNLWGFKSNGTQVKVPKADAIRQELQNVGYKNLDLDNIRRSIRKHKPLTIDLASIAKGYAVDVIGKLLLDLGYHNHLVEIGGEIKAAGKRYDGTKWQIAIEKPSYSHRSIQKVIGLTDQSIATSGNYRNYFVINDTYYSHTIDPFTGLPVQDALASVSVISSSAARADALSTGIMAMGHTLGKQFAESNNIPALLIVIQTDNITALNINKFP